MSEKPKWQEGTVDTQPLPLWAVCLFTIAIIYQGFHFIEHVIQAYQHAWLSIPILHAHGALFFFDFEWLHFIFDVFYLLSILTVAVFVWIRRKRFKISPWYLRLLLIAVAVLLWHATEHSVRIEDHIHTGCEACPGILGQYLDLVFLHFFYNLVGFALPFFVYLRYGAFKTLWNKL